MSRYVYTGSAPTSFPTLGRVVHPGETVDIDGEVSHGRLAPVDDASAVIPSDPPETVEAAPAPTTDLSLED